MKFIESLCKKTEDVIHALNSCHIHEIEKMGEGEELCFSVVLPWVEKKKKKRDKDRYGHK